jgi:solute carrier family 26, other
VLSTLISFLFHLNSTKGVKIVNNIPIGYFLIFKNLLISRFPTPHIPDFSLIPKVLPNAIGIAVVVLAIHISLAKMLAKKKDYKIDEGQVI